MILAGDGIGAGDFLIDFQPYDGAAQTEAPEQVAWDGMYVNAENSTNCSGVRTWGNGFSEDSETHYDYQEYRQVIKHAFISGVRGYKAFNAGTRRGYYENISVANCNCDIGFDSSGGSGDSLYIDVHVENVSGLGIKIARGFTYWKRPIAQSCNEGIQLGKDNNGDVRETIIEGGYTEFNDTWGIQVRDGVIDPTIRDLLVLGNGGETNSYAVQTGQTGGEIDVNVRDPDGGQTPGIRLTADAQDVNLAPQHLESQTTPIEDNGTRTRWHNVIGGGPLGGVDLSTVAGQDEGDLAVADGTSAAAAGAWARWDDANSQWRYVDPTGTV